MKQGEVKRTALWKLRNVPPIMFKLGLFCIPIYFFWTSWFTDTVEIEEMNVRASVWLVRGITALCAIWIVDCLTRIHGFTNPKTFLLYEIFKAMAFILFILLITSSFIAIGHYENGVGYFFAIFCVAAIQPVVRLRQLVLIIQDYKIIVMRNTDEISISEMQLGKDFRGPIYYVIFLKYSIEVGGVRYKCQEPFATIIRHKFADYKNGKPLRIIYSKKKPKFNIIFQE